MASALKLTQEEENFWKMCMVNLIIAPTAVRTYFDSLVAPQTLASTINQNIAKINSLATGRVINQSQLDILQKIPGTIWTSSSGPVPSSASGTSSKDFDLTLLICLLRNIVGIAPPSTRRWDVIPAPNEQSAGAFLVRLRMYRNELAHASETTMSVHEFNYKLQKIIEAVTFFNGGHPPACLSDIVNCDLGGSVSAGKVTVLSNQIDQIRKEYLSVKQECEAELKESEKLMEQIKSELKFHKEGTLPKNISDCIEVTLKQWKESDKPFYETRAAKGAFQKLKVEKAITIVGSSGSGKSALARHIALNFLTNGYQIVPIDDPDQMVDYRCKAVKQIFVIDDVIGKYIISLATLDKWERLGEKINQLFVTNETGPPSDIKLVCTLRTQIAANMQFKASNTVLNQQVYEIDTMGNKLSLTEKQSMLWNHLVYKLRYEQMTESDFKSFCKMPTCMSFPLLCQLFTSNDEIFKQGINFFKRPMDIVHDEISKLYYKNKEVYCALVINTVFSGRLLANIFDVSKPIDSIETVFHLKNCPLSAQSIISLIAETCGLNTNISRHVLLDNIASVVGTFVSRNSRNEFEFLHDFHREMISIHFSRVNFPLFVNLYDIDFLTKVLVINKEDAEHISYNESKILVQESYFTVLAKRFISEIEIGKFYAILTSQVMKHEPFVEVLCNILQQENCRGKLLRQKCSSHFYPAKTTRIFVPDKMFFIDAIDYMTKGPGSDHDDGTLFNWILITGCQPFFMCVWKHLTKREIKQYTRGHHSVLCYAVLGENHEIIETLIRNGASVNRASDDGLSPLSIAVRLASPDIVSLLLRYGAKIGMRESESRMTPIHIAAKKGCTTILDLLLTKSRSDETVTKCCESVSNKIEMLMKSNMSTSVARTTFINILLSVEVLPHCLYLNDIDIPNGDGDTPLHSAMSIRDMNTAHKLLQNGANPCLRNNDGYTATGKTIYYSNFHYWQFIKRESAILFAMLILCYTLCFACISIPYILFEVGEKEDLFSNKVTNDSMCYTNEVQISKKEKIPKFEYYKFLILFSTFITLGINYIMVGSIKIHEFRCKLYPYRRWIDLLHGFFVCRIIWFYGTFCTLLYNTSSLIYIASEHIFIFALYHISFYFQLYVPPFSLSLIYSEYHSATEIWNPLIVTIPIPAKYDQDNPQYGLLVKYLITCPLFAKSDLENIESAYTSYGIFFVLILALVFLGVFCFIHLVPAILFVFIRKRIRIEWIPVSILLAFILLMSVRLSFSILELPCGGRYYDIISFSKSRYEETLICKKELCRTEYVPVAVGNTHVVNPMFSTYDNPKYKRSGI